MTHHTIAAIFPRPIAAIIYSYIDYATARAIAAKTYCVLEINMLNVVDLVHFAPSSICRADEAPFMFQYLVAHPPIHSLLQSREDTVARYLRRAAIDLPFTSHYDPTRWYLVGGYIGHQCVCGNIGRQEYLTSNAHLESAVHRHRVALTITAITAGRWEEKADIQGSIYTELWAEILGGANMRVLLGLTSLERVAYANQEIYEPYPHRAAAHLQWRAETKNIGPTPNAAIHPPPPGCYGRLH